MDSPSPFQWTRVKLNCSFSLRYNPSLPQVLLLQKDNELPCRQATYADNVRATGQGRDLARAGIQQLKLGMNSLGN